MMRSAMTPQIFERKQNFSRFQVQYLLDSCCVFEGGQNLSRRPTFRDWSRATHSVVGSGFGYSTELRSSTSAQFIAFLNSIDSQGDSHFVSLFSHLLT
jgi:hypothetical protein